MAVRLAARKRGGVIAKIERANESADVEILRNDPLTLRVSYQNCFYGKCTASVELKRTSQGLGTADETFVVYDIEVRRGSASSLIRVVQDFLHQAVLSDEKRFQQLGRKADRSSGLTRWLRELMLSRLGRSLSFLRRPLTD